MSNKKPKRIKRNQEEREMPIANICKQAMKLMSRKNLAIELIDKILCDYSNKAFNVGICADWSHNILDFLNEKVQDIPKKNQMAIYYIAYTMFEGIPLLNYADDDTRIDWITMHCDMMVMVAHDDEIEMVGKNIKMKIK